MKSLIIGLMAIGLTSLLPGTAQANQKCSGRESLMLYNAPARVQSLVQTKFKLTLQTCNFGNGQVYYLTKAQASEARVKQILEYLKTQGVDTPKM